MDRFLTPGDRVGRIIECMDKEKIRSLNELAREAGIDRSTLSRAMGSGNMNISTLIALATALNCKAGYLIDV